MARYLTPGVYVEEVSTGARPIEAVGTSTAAFVGVAPQASALVNEAVPVGNWGEFTRSFVGESDASTPLANAVHGFFLNGGARCYVVNIGAKGDLSGNGAGLDVLEAIDDVAMVAAPGFTGAAAYDALLGHAENLGTRIALLDSPDEVQGLEALTRVAAVGSGDEPGDGEKAPDPSAGPGLRARESPRGYGCQYFPFIRTRDALDPGRIVSVPPSGHIAGVFARSDTERGVHAAPANMTIRGALGVTRRLTDAEQGLLNPAGVNAIRLFEGRGVMLWGARTLAPGASEWRYVNVRRLFVMARESIRRGTQWAVFQPNDRPLWKSLRRDVSAFLMLLWREGALMGATPEEAFFVKCDEETNTPAEIEAGRVVALIGMAPVRPAEFVILRISQSASGAAA